MVFEPVSVVLIGPTTDSLPCGKPAAVGVNQASNQLARMTPRELLLPTHKEDQPFVLSAWPVLRKQLRPGLRVGRDDYAPGAGYAASRCFAPAAAGDHRFLRARDQAGIGAIHCQPQGPTVALVFDEMPIAQIKAEQVCVLARGVPRDIRWPDEWQPVTQFRTGTPSRPPVRQGPPTDTRRPRYRVEARTSSELT